MKTGLLLLAGMALAVGGAAYAQTFPFDEDFSSYAPGSTGAPAWSTLQSTHWNVQNGGLRGDVFARFNRKPPSQYTAEMLLETASSEPLLEWSAGFTFNSQDEQVMRYADSVRLTWIRKSSGIAGSVHPEVDREPLGSPVKLPAMDTTVRLRLVVDSETGRYAVFVGDSMVYTGASEYAAGLLAVALSDETVRLKRFTLKLPTADEKRELMVKTLFNDPRDIADGGDGTILVLHRGSPAVLAVSADGEIKRSYGRRKLGPLSDPVALAISKGGETLVLNRFPGEVIRYDPNGGIRGRFGAKILKAPSDIAVLEDGTVYVLDLDGEEGVIRAFTADGVFISKTKVRESSSPRRGHIAGDGTGGVRVSWPFMKTISLRPNPSGEPKVVREEEGELSDLAVSSAGLRACGGSMVTPWPLPGNDTGFLATAVGGLGRDLRLATVGGTLYVLDREHSRIIAVPADLKDTSPEVTFQNISGSSALVRWTSAAPVKTARVHLLRGSTWTVAPGINAKASTSQQVPLERLLPGVTYKYEVSPTQDCIPPRDWSVPFTFTTPGAEAKS